ncbi:MAG TPA: triose-phosphate isomerase [Polyangiaceae bacterium]|jgi:triosephosphate isomerase|nr:MAG: Bifunctional PGK [Deltaproteobacteria bacterium ADurb.Bin207]HNS95407.1 triose-phosphate isomerase [Polyangiaceae bacterium]HNZ20653.1 triose-phosphate isomerase [Polyangiaceae bacterium]HOD20731.1 triose-phosphate isomerase [Polyangiaceae bacterium]HOE47151.1 triose-phosphate isomerase [Polyangiaceae bacterium]
MNKARRPLIAGNWKMNHGGANACNLASAVKRTTAEFDKVDVVVCPPFTAIAWVAEELRGSAVQVGAQNVHPKDSGAFTGEVSASMLLDAGARWVILGHSERRAMFGETDTLVAEKTRVALDVGLRPIVCVGELLEEREKGQTLDVVKRQLNAFASILADKPGVGAIAYEPVWAIGTGKTAGPAEAQEVHAMIRARLREISAEVAEKTRILYGGSMKASNAEGLLACEDVDGGLIGGASLKAEDFAGIALAGQKLA